MCFMMFNKYFMLEYVLFLHQRPLVILRKKLGLIMLNYLVLHVFEGYVSLTAAPSIYSSELQNIFADMLEDT